MMKRVWGVATVLCVVTLVCVGFFLVEHHFLRIPWKQTSVPVSATLNGKRIVLETVQTPEDREMGLSGRRTVPTGYAMRFIFERPAMYPFWMQGMWVPLDIVWVREGVVVDRARLDPPATFFSDPPMYVPHDTADTVYEFAAGEADDYGLSTGTRVYVVY